VLGSCAESVGLRIAVGNNVAGQETEKPTAVYEKAMKQPNVGNPLLNRKEVYGTILAIGGEGGMWNKQKFMQPPANLIRIRNFGVLHGFVNLAINRTTHH